VQYLLSYISLKIRVKIDQRKVTGDFLEGTVHITVDLKIMMVIKKAISLFLCNK
jgi:hypothetical protein